MLDGLAADSPNFSVAASAYTHRTNRSPITKKKKGRLVHKNARAVAYVPVTLRLLLVGGCETAEFVGSAQCAPVTVTI